mgnify:FL=1
MVVPIFHVIMDEQSVNRRAWSCVTTAIPAEPVKLRKRER